MQQPLTSKSILLRWIVVLTVSVIGLFFVKDIEVREDAMDLLPAGAVGEDLQLLARIGFVDRIFISLAAPSYEDEERQGGAAGKVTVSADAVGRALKASPLFKEVWYRMPEGSERFFYQQLWTHLPALLYPSDLRMIEDLSSREGLGKKLLDDFLLLNSVPGIALKDQIRRDPLGFSSLIMKRLENLRGEFEIEVRNGFFMNREGNSCLLWAESLLPLTDSQSAEQVKQEIDSILRENLAPGIQASIIGSLPHTLANARTVRQDLQKLLPVALALLIILFIAVFRNIRAFMVVGIPFLAAPSAIAATMLFFDRVSAMALGFGIVLLGISVDFAIHLFTGLSKESEAPQKVLNRLRKPIIMATASTLGVFMVLFFSDVPSHRQMALLAIAGVSLAAVFAWFLVPTLTGGKNAPFRPRSGEPVIFQRKSAATGPGGAVSIVLWILLLAAGALAWPKLHYNGDLRRFDISDPKIEAAEAKFQETWGRKGDQSFVFATGDDLSEALQKNDLVHKALQPSVPAYQTIATLLPGPATQLRNISGWQEFWTARKDRFLLDFENIAEETGFSANAFRPFLDWLSSQPAPIVPKDFLESPLAPVFGSLLHVPESDENGKALAPHDSFLVATIVPENEGSTKVLAGLETEIPGVRVLSNTSWRTRVENLLRKDILGLSCAAALLVVALIVFFFRRPGPVIAVLAPVLSALAAMAVFDFMTTRDLNLMHVLMGIMVIGLSVDYGIFMACSQQEGMRRSTILAVSTCALSSLTGFGVLAFAAHPVLQALGVTVLAGIGAAWPTALWVTPALLHFFAGEEKR